MDGREEASLVGKKQSLFIEDIVFVSIHENCCVDIHISMICSIFLNGVDSKL